MTDEQLLDLLTCCGPREAWDAMLANLKVRAQREDEIAKELEGQVRDLAEQAEQHFQRALEFSRLWQAMQNAPVESPSQADTHPKDGDDFSAPLVSGGGGEAMRQTTQGEGSNGQSNQG